MSLEQLELAYHVWSGSFEDFETAYTQVAEAGISSIVLTAVRGNLDLRVPEDLKEAGRILRRLGLAAPACHCQDWGPCHLTEPEDRRPAMLEMHTGLIQAAAELGARTFVLHIGHLEAGVEKEVLWERVRRAVDALVPQAEALGMLLALENGMQGYLATNQELLSFVADYDCPTVGICYDSGHAHVMGDAAATLHSLSPYVVTVHLHDNDGIDDLHLLPGQGTIDWNSVAQGLEACPKLLHIETEAANCPQWPHSRDLLSYRDAYELYRRILSPRGV